MDAAAAQAIVSAVIGPGGGLIVSLGVLYWIATSLFPAVQRFLDGLTTRLDRQAEVLERISDNLRDLNEAMEDMRPGVKIRSVKDRSVTN